MKKVWLYKIKCVVQGVIIMSKNEDVFCNVHQVMPVR